MPERKPSMRSLNTVVTKYAPGNNTYNPATVLPNACLPVNLDINPAEKRILREYADMFELEEQKTEDMIGMAKSYALEQALTPMTSRSELYSLAERLEMSQEDALRSQIQWKKRG